jgi:hypothetical protein
LLPLPLEALLHDSGFAIVSTATGATEGPEHEHHLGVPPARVMLWIDLVTDSHRRCTVAQKLYCFLV